MKKPLLSFSLALSILIGLYAQNWDNFYYKSYSKEWSKNKLNVDTLKNSWFAHSRGVNCWQISSLLTTYDSSFYQIICDKNDSIWGFNYFGLNKYSNNTWNLINDSINKTNSLSLFQIDRKGNILKIHAKGILYKITDKWESIVQDSLISAVFDNDTNLWAITSKRLYCYKNGIKTEYVYPNLSTETRLSSINNNENQLIIGIDSIYASSQNHSLVNFSKGNWEKLSDKLSYVFSKTDNNGTIWFIGDSIYKVKGSSITCFARLEKLLKDKIDNIYVSNDTTYFSYGFITIISYGDVLKVINKGTLVDNEIYCSTIDSKGNKWFATRNGTIMKFDGKNWDHFFIEKSWKYNSISKWIEDIAVADNGIVYVGTLNKELLVFDGTNWDRFSVGSEVNDIIIYDNTKVFLATNKGISVFNGSQLEHYSKINGIADTIVISGYLDNSNRIWFGTMKGITIWNGSSFSTLTDTLTIGYVKCITSDISGNIWASIWHESFRGALIMYDGQQWKIETEKIPTENGWFIPPFGITFDKKDNLWVLDEGGLSILYKSGWSILNHKDGMLPGSLETMDIDSDGSIWIGTEYGVSHFLNNNKFECLTDTIFTGKLASSETVYFTSNCRWKIYSDDAFDMLTVDKYEGTGNNNLNIHWSDNPLAKERIGKISIWANGVGQFQVVVIQKAADAKIELSTSSIKFKANDALSWKVIVKSNSEWKLEGAPEWIVVTKKTGYLKDTIYISVSNNQNLQRGSTLEFTSNGQSAYLEVVQEGKTTITDSFEDKVVVFPQIVTNEINVTSVDAIASISLFNIHGQEVYTSMPSQLKVVINATNIQMGIYLLKVITSNKDEMTYKILKK